MGASIQPNQFDIDTTQPVDIDETEEMERLLSLKHRETLIRGMGKYLNLSSENNVLFLSKWLKGIIDLCHRMLSNSNGVMPNFPPSPDVVSNPSTQRNAVVYINFSTEKHIDSNDFFLASIGRG